MRSELTIAAPATTTPTTTAPTTGRAGAQEGTGRGIPRSATTTTYSRERLGAPACAASPANPHPDQ